MPLVDDDFTAQIFWSTTDVLNFARVLVNDAQGSLAGQDLSDSRPYTWTLLNLCYAKLQNWLEDSNVESVTYAEWRLGPLPSSANAGSDPSMICRLGYNGFYDGDGFLYETPKLPPDLLQPLQLWERQGGSVQSYTDMQEKQGGFGPWAGSGPYRFWEFRENAIYMPASTYSNELRIRGIPALPLLGPNDETQPPQRIPLARAGEALAYMVAAEFAEIRNSANAPILRAKANEQLQIIANKSAKRSNQAQVRRKGYGFNRRRSFGWL